MSQTVRVHPTTDLEWLIEALDLDVPVQGPAVPPVHALDPARADPAIAQRQQRADGLRRQLPAAQEAEARGTEWDGVAKARGEALALLDKPGRTDADLTQAEQRLGVATQAATAARAAIATRLTQAAAEIEKALTPYDTADLDAVGAEWSGVKEAVTAVRACLAPETLSNKAIAAATEKQSSIGTAVSDAKAAIQSRLSAAARPLREKAQTARTPHVDAEGSEWSAVSTLCDAVEQAVPAGTLSNEGLKRATEAAGKIDKAVSDAESAIATRLTQQAAGIEKALKPYDTADLDAVGAEWSGVKEAVKAVRACLAPETLSNKAIAAATEKQSSIGEAVIAAKAAIQSRLSAAARPLREKAQTARTPHVDAEGSEWSAVSTLCDAVEQAVPAGTLSNEGLKRATEAAGKIDKAVSDAERAIATRLTQQAAGIEQALTPYDTQDPEAVGAEWTGVKEAVKAVRALLRPERLSNKAILEAKQKQSSIGQAVIDAKAAIQSRLRTALQVETDKIAQYQAVPASATGTEWDGVTAACNVALGLVPPVGQALTASAVAAVGAAVKKIGSPAVLARTAIQNRLNSAANKQRERAAPYAAPEPGGAEFWTPISEACKRIRLALPRGKLTSAGIKAATDEADGLAGLLATACTAIWEEAKEGARKRINTIQGGDKKLSQVMKTIFPAEPEFKALIAVTGREKGGGEALVSADLASLRTQRARLGPLIERVCDAAAGLLEAAKTAPTDAADYAGAVKAAVADARPRVMAKAAVGEVFKRAAEALAALEPVIADAAAAYAFRSYDPASDKSLKDIVFALTQRQERLKDGLNGKEGDKWSLSSLVVKMNGTDPFGADDLTGIEKLVVIWNTAIETAEVERRKSAVAIAKMRASGENATPCEPVYGLEVVRQALVEKLYSKTARSLRDSLSKAKAPAAVWKKSFDDAVAAQLSVAVDGETWGTRIGATKTSKAAASMGWDNTGTLTTTINGETRTVETHVTLYAAGKSAKLNLTAAEIVEAVIGTGTGGIHCTLEFHGKDNKFNPKKYRSHNGLYIPGNPAGDQLRTALDTKLAGFVATFAPYVQEWLDRGGQDPGQWAASQTYRAAVEKEIAAAG